jgi:argininosuccinate lyase
MSESEFRATLNPLDIVKNRATSGGLQPSEMKRMLALSRQWVADYNEWVRSCRVRIDMALAKLDADFAKLLVD